MSNSTVINGPILPISDHWSWQQDGACSTSPSELFFFPDGERGQLRLRREIAAKAICFNCPVIGICRDFALTAHEPYGVWGGLSEVERGFWQK